MGLKEEYKTVGGKRVINLNYVPFNSAGGRVTFPIKGTIILQEKEKGKRTKTEYCIWTEDGKKGVFGNSEFDLVL